MVVESPILVMRRGEGLFARSFGTWSRGRQCDRVNCSSFPAYYSSASILALPHSLQLLLSVLACQSVAEIKLDSGSCGSNWSGQQGPWEGKEGACRGMMMVAQWRHERSRGADNRSAGLAFSH